MKRRPLLSGLLAASLVVGAMPAAWAATSAEQAVGARMNRLGILQGSGVLPNGEPDLNLDGKITRAELVTTIVRSFGLELSAKASQSISSFADVPGGQWYSGYVAVANSLAQTKGIAIGRSATVFDPNASVTKAEALVFVMKFLGLNATGTGAAWYDPWIDLAEAQGLFTPSERVQFMANPGEPATRGGAFVVLDLGYKAKVLPGGLSLYTQYVDPVAPTVTLVSPPTVTADAKITLTGSVSDNKGIASIRVNGDTITPSGNTFTVSIPLNAGPNSIQVEVTDLAGNVQRESFTVTRSAAQPAAIEAHNLTVGAGQTVEIGAVVKDASGLPIPGAVINGTSTLGTVANGRFTAGGTLGTDTLTLQAAGGIRKEISVTVVAGPVAKVLPASVGPGGSVQLQATDAYGNPVTSGITWSLQQNQAGAVLSPDGTFRGMAAGNYVVMATQNGTSIVGQVGVYGMATRLRVEAPATVVGNGVTNYTVKVYGVDTNNFVNTDFHGLVSLDTAFGTVAPVVAENGVATFTFTASDTFVGEKVQIDATAPGGLDGLEGSTTVQVVAQVARGIKIQPAAAFLTSNSTSTLLDLDVQVVDQEGAPMLEGDYSLDLTVSGPATFGNGSTTQELDWNPFVDGVQIKPTEIGVTGTVKVTATASGLTAGSAEVTARMAGTARQITLKASKNKIAAQPGSSLTNAVYFEAALVDAAGVPVTPDDKDLKVTFTGIAADDLERHSIAFDYNLDGELDGGEGFDELDVAELTLTDVPNGKMAFWVIGEQAGSFSVSVAEVASAPTLTTSPAISYTVTAGAPHHFEGLLPQALLLQRGQATTLEYQVVDALGNPVTQPNLTLVFDPTGTSGLKLDGKTTAVKVLTDARGIASVSVVAETVITTPGGVPVSINRTATNTANGWTTAIEWDTHISSMIIAPGEVETRVEIETESGWSPLVGAMTAGSTVRVVATVKDTQGYPLPGIGTTVPTELVVTSTGTTQTNLKTVTFSDANNDGVYESSPIIITKAGTQTLKAELSNLPINIVTRGRSITVRAGALDGVRISPATSSTIKLKANQAKEFTIQLVDTWGNPVLSSAVTHPVKFTFSHTASSGEYASFRDADGAELISSGIQIGAGKTTAKFYLITSDLSGNTITINAILDDDGSGTFGGGDTVYSITYTLVAE